MGRNTYKVHAPRKRKLSRYDSDGTETNVGGRIQMKIIMFVLITPGIAGVVILNDGGSRPMGFALIGVSIALAAGLAAMLIHKTKKRARLEQSRLARREQRPRHE